MFFSILQKNLAMFFKFQFYFVHGNNLNLPAVEHGTNHLGTEKVCFLFYFNNFHSQNVKPCGRTTRFSALHWQGQKGHLTVLDLGGGGWYLASCQYKYCNLTYNKLLLPTCAHFCRGLLVYRPLLYID